MINALTAIGRNAQWLLALGAIAALFAGPLSALMRPALPVMLAGLYALAIMRIDPLATLRDALRPRTALRNLMISAAMMVATPAAFWAAATAMGAPGTAISALVYWAAAPAIGSAASYCLLLGFSAELGLQITVLSALLAPLLGPLVVTALLGDAVPIDALSLMGRLALLIGLGAAAALIARRVLTPSWIDNQGEMLNGVATLTMLLFLLPLFEGVGAQVWARPWVAVGVLALALAANFGTQLVAARLAQARLTSAQAGAVGVLAGNRNVSLYLAALPSDPAFSLFVAMCQYPIYLTPLAWRLAARSGQGTGAKP